MFFVLAVVDSWTMREPLVLCLRVVVVYIRFVERLNEVKQVIHYADLARLHANKIIQPVRIG